MHSSGKIEDRVFGQPEKMPAPQLATRESREFDLLGVTVEGAEAAYAQQGRVALPPLVFLHGWGSSHKWWRYQLAAFSPRYRCIAPDWVGFGLSEKPKRDYSLEAMAAWLGKFLDALNLPKVTLVGHSMGGTIGLLFALACPDRVEKLAVVNPLIAGPTAFSGKTKFSMLPGVRLLLYGLARVGPIRRWVAKDFSYAAALDDELAKDVTRGSCRSTFDTLAELKRIDLRPRLAGLKVPTLAVGTDQDRIVAPGQHALVPARKQVQIAEAGHVPMVERPAEFNAILDGFLREA